MCAPKKPLNLSCVSVSHGLSWLVERPGLFASEGSRSCTFPCDRAVIHVFCMSGSVYLCLSDPRVTSCSPSRLPTPYQTRERTRDARMYHSHQFCFSFPPRGGRLMRKNVGCVYQNTISDVVLWEISFCITFEESFYM